MARQPESIDGVSIDMTGRPEGQDPSCEEPIVGDIYRPRAGAAAFWWIVGICQGEYHHTAYYLTFNHKGEFVGQGRVGMHYLRERVKAGHADVPALEPEWY